MLIENDVLRRSPDHVNAVFQMEHVVSGQELQSYSRWVELFRNCGFDIVHQEVHSSIPDSEAESGQKDTPITFFLKAKSA